MLKLLKIGTLAAGLLAPAGSAYAQTPAAADDEPEKVKCEKIADAFERTRCIIATGTGNGGGVTASQPTDLPGVLAAPPGN
jgi:hypothetical protein